MTAVAPYPTRRRAGAPTGLAAGVGLMLGLLLALLLAALPAAGASVAQDGRFDPFQAAGIDPTPGAPVPGDARFLDAAGDTVRLGDLFTGERPVLLAPVYYTCPNVCGATLAGLFGALGTMPLVPGDDYLVVALSFDPKEGPDEARDAKARAVERLGTAEGVRFLTGGPEAIEAVTRALGFRFAWDPDLGQYAHAAAVVALTPDGRQGPWIYGLWPRPTDLRLALVEAGQGTAGRVTDRLLLLCYAYDPTTGQYGGLIRRVLQAGGIATVLALGGFVGLALRSERRRARTAGRRGPPAREDRRWSR